MDEGSFKDILAKASSPGDLAVLFIAAPVGYLLWALLGIGLIAPATFALLFGVFFLGVKKAFDARAAAVEERGRKVLKQERRKALEQRKLEKREERERRRVQESEAPDSPIAQFADLLYDDLVILAELEVTDDVPQYDDLVALRFEAMDQRRLFDHGLIDDAKASAFIGEKLPRRQEIWRTVPDALNRRSERESLHAAANSARAEEFLASTQQRLAALEAEVRLEARPAAERGHAPTSRAEPGS